MGCSVMAIKEMSSKAKLSMNCSVSIHSWSWLFSGGERKNKTRKSSSWEEFPQSVWARSEREGNEPDIREAHRGFLGRNFPPSRPWGRLWARWEDYSSLQPPEGLRTLAVVEKLVRVSLLTVEPHKQRKMEQKDKNLIELFNLVLLKWGPSAVLK